MPVAILELACCWGAIGLFAQDRPSNVAVLLQHRIEEIAEARSRNPEVFALIETYRQTDVHPCDDVWPKSILGTTHIRFKTPALEVLHPDYREAARQYPAAFSGVQQAAARRDTCNDSQGYEAELTRIQAENHVPPDVFVQLRQACCHEGGMPRFDPDYILAWEEGALSPDTPWRVKAWFVKIIVSISDPQSAVVLGCLIRDALEFEAASTDKATWLAAMSVESDALNFLRDHPSPMSLVVLSEASNAFGLADGSYTSAQLQAGEKLLTIRRMIAGRLGTSQAWSEMLNDPKIVATSAEHARRLQEVLAEDSRRSREE